MSDKTCRERKKDGKLEAAFYLAVGSRDTLRDYVDAMRTKLHPDDSTLDDLVENMDRIAEIIKESKDRLNELETIARWSLY